jgi:DnaJ family protein C protein 28
MGDGDLNKHKKREMGVDQSIREAISRGDFDDLPGKGKPLNWTTERDDEWWLANHLLQNAGYRPEFIESDQAIRAEREALAKMLTEHEAWHHAHAGREPEPSLRRAAEAVAARYRERAGKLNREVERHNLSVPEALPSMQRIKIQVDVELEAFFRRLGLAA